MSDTTEQPMSDAVRDSVGHVAYLAERFTMAYYSSDFEWGRWLADLRVALRRLDRAERAGR